VIIHPGGCAVELKEKIEGLKKKIEVNRGVVQTEEAVKTAFVLPMLQILGYNVFDPKEVVPEFISDWGKRKGEKVDYAVNVDGKTVMLLECKSLNAPLDINEANQLGSYFHHTTGTKKIGVLTNGTTYNFYTDLKNDNVMDTEPFLVFDFNDANEDSIARLEMFTRENVAKEESRDQIKRIKNFTDALRIVKSAFDEPSPEFAKWVIHQIDGVSARSETIDEFQGHIKKAVSEVKNTHMLDSFNKMRRQEEQLEQGEVEPVENEKAVTTIGSDIVFENELGMYQELQGLTIARSILYSKKKIPPSDVTLRDWKSYCNIIYGGKANSILLRMHFNRADEGILFLEFPHDESLGKIKINNVQEMNDYADSIVESTERFLV